MSGLRDRMNRLRGAAAASQTVEAESDCKQMEELNGSLESGGEHIAASSGSLGLEGELTGAPSAQPEQPGEQTEQLHPAWSAIGARLERTPDGEFLIRRESWELHHRHGIHALGELRAAAGGLAAFHPGQEKPVAERVLYLDLETTGLGVGAGNVPFMVGLAYMEEDRFTVEQMLIRNPAEEYAMLRYLARRLQHFTYLATYNGKTFDWPLIANRMIMNGIREQTGSLLHMDFLHPSRSIWRNTLASCKLSHIEEERLGITRKEDVPGSLAPQLYFQYLADGDPEPLHGVFRHNADDLKSLACLSIRFGQLLAGYAFDRIGLPEEAEELIRTGLWLERMGGSPQAERLFRQATLVDEASASALLMLASRDKKAGNWERAVLLWQKAILNDGARREPASIEACIELAMYNEHKLKRFEEALSYASKAFELLEERMLLQRRDAKRRAELEAVRVRIRRLKRKLGAVATEL